jgi:excisionase family DNA binding protein
VRHERPRDRGSRYSRLSVRGAMPTAHPQDAPEMSQPSTAPEPTEPARRKNLTAEEAALYLNISLRTLHSWLREGIIEGHRLGPKFLRFDADDLDRARSRF